MIKITYGGGHSPRLFIDRLTVLLSFDDDEEATGVHAALFTAFSDPDVFSGSKPPSGVKAEKSIKIDGLKQKHWPYLEYRYSAPYARQMRLSLHPADMGLSGFEALHDILTMFVSGGWGAFVQRAKVTIIEVSIDLPGIAFDHIHILPSSVQTYTVYQSGQKAETVYLGKPNSNQTKIYNRGLKREKQGQEDKAGPCTRVERVLKSPNKLVKDLKTLKNPFTNVAFVDLPQQPPSFEKKPYIWTMFTDSVAQRGLHPALKMLPEKKRLDYQGYVEGSKKAWWLPKAIWGGWPKVVDDLKLTDEAYW